MAWSEVLNYAADTGVSSKPSWLRVKAPQGAVFRDTMDVARVGGLKTVCEEAACPNIGECWNRKHATFMIMGHICTRSCRFCNIATGIPDALDLNEPHELSSAVAKLGLKHVVITSVDRDDLQDGGAQHFVQCIRAIRSKCLDTTIEILTPDFRRKDDAILTVADAQPDVYNHNIETVPSLYPEIRPGARYFHSLYLLKIVKQKYPHMFTKSGIMLGLGERESEIKQVMDDLRSADVDFMTIGQYLQPTPKHAIVKEYVHPDKFKHYKEIALSKGFLMVASSPLTRSSYHASEDFEEMRSRRLQSIMS